MRFVVTLTCCPAEALLWGFFGLANLAGKHSAVGHRNKAMSKRIFTSNTFK